MTWAVRRAGRGLAGGPAGYPGPGVLVLCELPVAAAVVPLPARARPQGNGVAGRAVGHAQRVVYEEYSKAAASPYTGS